MLNLIAETNGTRAVYHVVKEDGTVSIGDGSEISIPVIAWDSSGSALVADPEMGRLVRAVDALVINDENKRCNFTALDLSIAATGNLLP